MDVEQRKADRRAFLQALYETCQADAHKHYNPLGIGILAELDRGRTVAAVEYLIGEQLVERRGRDLVGITHEGLQLAEVVCDDDVLAQRQADREAFLQALYDISQGSVHDFYGMLDVCAKVEFDEGRGRAAMSYLIGERLVKQYGGSGGRRGALLGITQKGIRFAEGGY